MILRWIDRAKAQAWNGMIAAEPVGNVAVYVDSRLEPYFRESPLILVPKGVGPFRNLKVKPDKAFSQFVSRLLDDAFDVPHG